MDLQKLQRVVVDALEDVKAQDIKVFNTVGISDMFDRVILASGTSNRQTRALAWSVVGKVKESGGEVVSVEGTDPGEWVLVDLGDVVVHIMQPAIRDYYGLEEMWGSKPLKVKLASAQRGNKPRDEVPVAATEAEPAPAAKTRKVAKKTAGTTKSAAKKVPARKVAAKKAPATKAPARKAPAKKAPAKKAATKKAATKKVAKKAPSPSARKSPASKSAAKKVAAKRTAKAAKAVKTAKAARKRSA